MLETASIPLSAIRPNPNQPRRDFDPDALAELAASIRQHGILEPIIVRPVRESPKARATGGGHYQIVAGERRWRAAQLAGLTRAPAVIRADLDDAAAFELSMVENVIRADMNPMEEAHGYQTLLDSGMTLETIAERIGKAPASIRSRLSLLRLASPIQDLVGNGQVDCFVAGHLGRLSTEGQYQVMRRLTAAPMGPLDAARLCTAVAEREAKVEMFPEAFMSGTMTVLASMPPSDPKAIELERALIAAVDALERAAKLADSGTTTSTLESASARVSALAARLSKSVARRRAEQIAMSA